MNNLCHTGNRIVGKIKIENTLARTEYGLSNHFRIKHPTGRREIQEPLPLEICQIVRCHIRTIVYLLL